MAGRTAGMGGSSLLAAILMGREQRLLIGSYGGPSPLNRQTARYRNTACSTNEGAASTSRRRCKLFDEL